MVQPSKVYLEYKPEVEQIMEITSTLNELVTPKEASKLMGISKCSVYRWIKHGWLVGIKMPNGTIRIPKVLVNEILAGK